MAYVVQRSRGSTLASWRECVLLLAAGLKKGVAMERDEWQALEAMTDAQLLDFMTELPNSQRRHAAEHILAMRRGKLMERIGMWSAIAAALSAFVAVLQLFK